MKATLVESDILDFIEQEPSEKFHALFCDAPYGLAKISVEKTILSWIERKNSIDKRGFMNMAWDVVPAPDAWRGLSSYLYDGALVMSFGGSRTSDLLSVSMRLGGLDKFDELTIFWVHSQGFGKQGYTWKNIEKEYGSVDESWKHHGKALTPSHEPVLAFRYNRVKTYAQHALEDGTASLNIDGTRIPRGESITINTFDNGAKPWGNAAGEAYTSRQSEGNWPKNVILVHHDDCVPSGSRMVRAAGGKSKPRENNQQYTTMQNKMAYYGPPEGFEGYGKDGKEMVVDWDCHPECPIATMNDQKENSARFFYQAKASKKEKNFGVEDWFWVRDKDSISGYRRVNHETKLKGNIHPSVKPIALTEYIAKLLLPPESVKPRRLLIPFCGSGSEIIGALQAGWDEVVGIDFCKDYLDIAEARLNAKFNGIFSNVEIKRS